MVNTEDGTSITWNINQELDKRLQTFPASTGVRETNFIKRCIEQLKQRLLRINVWSTKQRWQTSN